MFYAFRNGGLCQTNSKTNKLQMESELIVYAYFVLTSKAILRSSIPGQLEVLKMTWSSIDSFCRV